MTELTREQQQLDELKRNWLADPCWDIEETEGWEAHREELKAFRLETEAANRATHQRELQAFADNLGIGDNLALAGYIRMLQRRIEQLEAKLSQHTIA